MPNPINSHLHETGLLVNAPKRLVTHVAGARPNFPKLGPVWRALSNRGIRQRLIHTGQHYDDALSASFFRDLALPTPDVNLGVGSGSHAVQTAATMVALESQLLDHTPDIVVVYGDINSTLAAAIVCAKMGIPLAHVEAGLRSFDDSMPEEINRRVTDLLSSLLLATSDDAVANLLAEGIPRERVSFVGNPMIDSLFHALPGLDAPRLPAGLAPDSPYAVVTLHRPANVDDPDSIAKAVAMVNALAAEVPVVMPLHPRGRERMRDGGLDRVRNLFTTNPMPYLQFLALVRGASLVVTDSGGIQEETTMLEIPCITVRPNTERPVTITHGTNRLATPEEVPTMAAQVLARTWLAPQLRPPLWDGAAGPRIAAAISEFIEK